MSDSRIPRLTRRDALRLFGAYAGLGVLAACTPIGTQSGAPASGSSAQKAIDNSKVAPAPTVSQPRTGGTLRLGTFTDLTTIDPHVIQMQSGLITPVYSLLARYDDKLQMQPELAESWELSSDAKQLRINLRQGVTFHSGREFTAEDVKYNILRVRDPKVGVAQLANQSKWIADMELPDKYTIIFKFDGPRPAIFDMINSFYMADKDTMEGTDAKTKAVGTGPFKFAEWIPGDHVRLVKNKDYWRKGQPYVDEIVFSIIKDVQALVVQFEAGAVDVALRIPEREVVRLQKDSKYRIETSTSGGTYYYVAANCTLAPTNNKKFRQAINYAIDRKRFVDTIMLGLGQPQDLPWPKHSPAYDSAKADLYSFNLDKAASLIKESGISNPEIDVVYSSANESYAGLAQILQSDLAKIGVKLNLKGVDPMRYREQVDNLTYQGLIISDSGNANLDPSTMFSQSKPWNFASNLSGFKNDKYTQLINSMSSEPDSSKRKQIFSEMNDLILDESFVMIASPSMMATSMRNNVHGPKRGPSSELSLEDTWLD